jgi:hypothetical protein
MGSRPRARSAPARGKAARRAVRAKSGSGLPLLPIVTGAILVVLAVAMVVGIVLNSRPTPGPTAVAGVPCDQLEHSQVHYHSALQIMYQGNVLNLPDNVGIQYDSTGQNITCYYWLHVHPGNLNVIHIEAPADKTFTLGQFFQIWNAWSVRNGKPAQKLDATHVSTLTLTPDQKIVTYIDLNDGKGPQLYDGDPSKIVLKSHEVITIEVAPPDVKPPSFTFEAGL